MDTTLRFYIDHRPGDRLRRRRATLAAIMFAIIGYLLSTAYFYWTEATSPYAGGDGLSGGWGYFCFAPCFFAPLSAAAAYLVAWVTRRRVPATRTSVGRELAVGDRALGAFAGVEAEVIDCAVVLRSDHESVRLELLVERDAVEMAHLIESEHSGA